MKKLYVLFLLIGIICKAQVINIPDANFREKLLNNQSASTENVDNPAVSGNFTTVDTNHNGQIEISEAQAITCLIVSDDAIFDLSGIEYFTNLQMLAVQYNYLTNIDLTDLVHLKYLFVDHNFLTSLSVHSSTNLKMLGCESNQISTIDVSEFTNLEYLNVSFNLLSSLNLNGLTHLTNVSCEYNQITALDFTGFNDLIVAKCNNNLIETLDFSTNPVNAILMCHSNPNLTSICIKNGVFNESSGGISEIYSNNLSLSYICADDLEINNLQTNLGYSGLTQPVTIDSACNLGNQDFNNTKVSLYPNPAKDILNIENIKNIASISIYNALGQQLLAVSNPDKKIDVSSLKTGNYFIKIVSDKGISTSKFVKI